MFILNHKYLRLHSCQLHMSHFTLSRANFLPGKNCEFFRKFRRLANFELQKLIFSGTFSVRSSYTKAWKQLEMKRQKHGFMDAWYLSWNTSFRTSLSITLRMSGWLNHWHTLILKFNPVCQFRVNIPKICPFRVEQNIRSHFSTGRNLFWQRVNVIYSNTISKSCI